MDVPNTKYQVKYTFGSLINEKHVLFNADYATKEDRQEIADEMAKNHRDWKIQSHTNYRQQCESYGNPRRFHHVRQRLDHLSRKPYTRHLTNRTSRSQVQRSEWNYVTRAVFSRLRDIGGNLDQPIGQRGYTYDHSAETGHVFFACGEKMLRPLSRCWKCRFIFNYNVNDGSMDVEDPATTVFTANFWLLDLIAKDYLSLTNFLF
ncbi:hypothetical protein MMC12_005915 [Toensbergia leucococca]|nr:hypothetical protein [Toensbergia leucococca]